MKHGALKATLLGSTSRLATLGWRPSIHLDQGLAATCAWFREHAAEARGMPKGRAA